MPLFEIVLFLMSYLIGSVPFGILFIGKKLTQVGSGNIGATNALRTGGSLAGAVTFFCDATKGMLVLYIVKHTGATNQITSICISLAVLGHIFPVWLKFRGGKGIATFFGIMLILYPEFAVVCCLLWIATFLLTKTASISSIFITLLAFTYGIYIMHWCDDVNYAAFMCVISIVIILKHKANIQRLASGKELSF